MIIDAHLHVIDSRNFDRETYDRLGLKVPGDTDLADLVRWLKEAGVSKAVCMGQDMTRIWNTTFGEERVIEAITEYPDFFIGMASVEPLDAANRLNHDGLAYAEKALTELGLRGILFTPPYGQYYSNDKTIYPFYELAQAHDAVVQFHHSAQMGPAILCPTKYADLYRLNDVTVDFPNLKIVVEHIGYPWSEHLFILMANHPQLYTDLAMMYDRPYKTVWSLVLAKEYGVIDRVMYASDYVARNYDFISDDPVADFKRWIGFVKEGINKICQRCGWPTFTDEEIDGILGENAARLYGFERTPSP